jgi:hypothetical protein
MVFLLAINRIELSGWANCSEVEPKYGVTWMNSIPVIVTGRVGAASSSHQKHKLQGAFAIGPPAMEPNTKMARDRHSDVIN